MNPDIWGVFHDGVLTGARVEGPASMVLTIEIPYLREMLPGAGNAFVVRLSGNPRLEYAEYGSPPRSSLEHAVEAAPELLYAEPVERGVELDCARGTLRVEYDDMAVSLDTGENVTYDELVSANQRYWDGWTRARRTD
ncbi:hypothetical protein [Hyalangium versicolor]|uniref:hypothetical protein n=1 Tax=Hyalangium versicolor TaxID=2861190 RepID=UPI001CCAB71C|nr:hypothetical protein [Hyalangium versicolor]